MVAGYCEADNGLSAHSGSTAAISYDGGSLSWALESAVEGWASRRDVWICGLFRYSKKWCKYRWYSLSKVRMMPHLV